MYDHQPEWRKNLPSIHSFEVRQKYLIKTKEYLDSIWYVPNEKDLKFITQYGKYYKRTYEQNSLWEGWNPFELISKINNG